MTVPRDLLPRDARSAYGRRRSAMLDTSAGSSCSAWRTPRHHRPRAEPGNSGRLLRQAPGEPGRARHQGRAPRRRCRTVPATIRGRHPAPRAQRAVSLPEHREGEHRARPGAGPRPGGAPAPDARGGRDRRELSARNTRPVGPVVCRAVGAQSRPRPGVDHPVRAGRSVSRLPHERDRRRGARRPALHHRHAGTGAAQDGRQSRAPQRRRGGLQRHHGGALAARSDGSGAADRPLDPGGDGDHADPREHRGVVAGHGCPADGERAGGGARRLGLDRARDGRRRPRPGPACAIFSAARTWSTIPASPLERRGGTTATR